MAARQLSIEGHSEIADFYSGRSVFITGASGFMGKVLVERLLSACPGVERLFLLLRPKKDVAPHRRLHQLKQSPIFENVRRANPAQLSKLEVVEGDITKPDLGLPPSALDVLKPVSVVFHTAATVKFDEELKMAVMMNVLAPLRVMEIARQLPAVEAFVHVSTAYCNCDKDVVEEKVYPPPADLDKLLAVCDLLPTELLAHITDKYIGDRPNTYTFTKAMGEHAVVKNAGHFPIAIFRPSIVTGSWMRPFPGWVDSLTGPTGLIVGAGKGVLRSMHCKRNYVTDMVPVDIAIDTLIAVAWQTATERSLDVKVFNCTTGGTNPIHWGKFTYMLRTLIRTHPFDDILWYPVGDIHDNKYIDMLNRILFQVVPAYLYDYTTWLLGIKTPMSMVKVSNRLDSVRNVLNFFAINEWQFKSDNVQKLHAKLSPGDLKLFNLDPNSIDWDLYFTNYVKGIRKYVLKEREENIDKAKQRLKRMFYIHYGTKILMILVILRTILMKSATSKKIVFGTIRMLTNLIAITYRKATSS